MVVRGDTEHVVPPSVDRFSPGSGVQRLQGGLLEAGVSRKPLELLGGAVVGAWPAGPRGLCVQTGGTQS